MSKKKPAPKKKPAAKAKTPAKPAKKRPAKPVTRRSTPRAVALPGMEQAVHQRLNTLCASISDLRADMNQLRQEEGVDCQNALTYMHDRGITTYQHAGVELVRVPGAEKLRVRTSKEKATAETEGSGQDAGEIAESLTEKDEAHAADLEG